MPDYKLVDVEGLKDVLIMRLNKQVYQDVRNLIGAHTVKHEWVRIENCDWPDDMIVHWADIKAPWNNGRISAGKLKGSTGLFVMPACFPAPPLPDSPEPEECDG